MTGFLSEQQGCVMSPWLFNVYMYGVVREVNAIMLGRGVRLVNANGRKWNLNQMVVQMIRH